MTAPTFLCARCAADPQPSDFGHPRSCGFTAIGFFTPDNWNCATLNALCDLARVQRIEGYDESGHLLYVPHVTGEDGGRGWIIVTRYKHRGCASSAVRVGDFWPPEPLTLQMCESLIALAERATVKS